MIVFGPLWFVVGVMLICWLFSGSKEDRWLERKRKQSIRRMMESEECAMMTPEEMAERNARNQL